MAELLVHREQDEGMSFGGRMMSAVQQWIPLLQRSVPTDNLADREAKANGRYAQQNSQQVLNSRGGKSDE